MAKSITFIELVEAIYKMVPPAKAPDVLEYLLEKGTVTFEDPEEAKRLIPESCPATT